MIYYHVALDGEYIEEEDNVKGFYDPVTNPSTFTNRRKAVAEAKRRLKAKIAELKGYLKELK